MAKFQRLRYLMMTLDPVHIGTGGHRLGRVDNSIIREVGTRIPKIPGTSLHGAARHYAAKVYDTPKAAGQDQSDVENPKDNPICHTFGYIFKSKDEDKEKAQGFSGLVNLFDAHPLLFPVYSMRGPVWVSTPERMREAGIEVPEEPAEDGALVTFEGKSHLNLGWLMLSELKQTTLQNVPGAWEQTQRWQTVRDSLVLVSDRIFSHIVNSNLEVRTSVSIDPDRGAAEDGALFTYEAIPRATFLTVEAVLDDYLSEKTNKIFPKQKTHEGNSLPGNAPWKGPLDVLETGIKMMEWFGIGGMGTRGFGRMAMVGEPVVLERYPEGGEDGTHG